MQFRPAPSHGSDRELHTPSELLQRPRAGDATHIKPLHQQLAAPSQPVQPGCLLAISASTNQVKQHGVRRHVQAATGKRKKRVTHKDASLAPEPVDYLKLRRTEQSKQALLRNRQVVQEIVSPTPLPSTSIHANAPQRSFERELHYELRIVEAKNVAVLDEFARSIRDKGQVENAAIAAGMQQLYREQQRVDGQTQRATAELQQLLTGIRNDISFAYKFTPLVRIYARHKLIARWHAWCEYVVWHRAEQERLQQLAPFAVPIQRVFRRKRTEWACARSRLALVRSQWHAAIALQCWAKRRLRTRALKQHHKSLCAARLQAAWRGRMTRKRVKRALQDQLRALLASFAPTGSLHRLREVVAHSAPALAAQVNAALSLVAETHVAVDGNTPHRSKHAAIAAQHFAKPVEATSKQLFHAVHGLRAALRERERLVVAAKAAAVRDARAKHAERVERDAATKREQLRVTQTRIAEDNERHAMHVAELETCEHMRMLRSIEYDVLARQQLRIERREQTENAHMVIEEYTTRYVVAESRRRENDRSARLREVTKREQMLQTRAQQQLAELRTIMDANERKRQVAELQRAAAEAAARAHWSALSRDEKTLALQRLELRDQQLRDQQRVLDAAISVQEATEREALCALQQQQRALKQLELERERCARDAMAREEQATRRWLANTRKLAHAQQWRAKRDAEKHKYSTDPLDFAHVQQQREQNERERRERYFMTQDDARSAHVRDQERKTLRITRCRALERQRRADEARERKERTLMEREDALAHAQRDAANRARAFQTQLRRMQALAAREQQREDQHVLEARRRKEMHDEELRQRRVAQTQAFTDSVREKRERQAMSEHERAQRVTDIAIAQEREKRRRAKMNLRMMQEDVASMVRQDYESEGLRLEQLLWPPHDAIAFAYCVTRHSALLFANVAVLRELVPALSDAAPPFNLDTDAVREFAGREHELPLDRVPRKRRKPRRFFYHEFFEPDLVLARVLPVAPLPTIDEQYAHAASQRARKRWHMLARHFLSRARSSDAARRGYLEMHNGQLEAASTSLLEAVRALEPQQQQVPAALVRQLARCYFRLWETTAQHVWLHRAQFYFAQASAHVALLASPAFLQELALMLEHAGQYRHAAEVLGGIIQCFPRYAQLTNVVFRGAVVLFALQLFHQAREYVLHVLDAHPFNWPARDLQLLAARVLQLEGKSARKLCEVAYEDAFRQRLPRTHHAVWTDWMRDADTWRHFGDACFARREFVLAKDAYQLMLQWQLHPRAHGAAAKRLQRTGHRAPSGSVSDSDDWLRLARVCAALDDRSKTELAISHWLAARDYRERVLEQFCSWPLGRWRLLGLDVPERIVRMREEQEKAQADAAERARQAIDLQREQVLRRRASRSRNVLIAWQSDSSGSDSVAAAVPTATAATTASEPTDIVNDANDMSCSSDVVAASQLSLN